MHALDLLGDPTRRRILELLGEGERAAGELVELLQREVELSQPAVSQHLRALRDAGFVSVRAEGQRRLYRLEPARLQEVDAWVARFRGVWEARLDALGTEIARGKRARGEQRRNQTRTQTQTQTQTRIGQGQGHGQGHGAVAPASAGATAKARRR